MSTTPTKQQVANEVLRSGDAKTVQSFKDSESQRRSLLLEAKEQIMMPFSHSPRLAAECINSIKEMHTSQRLLFDEEDTEAIEAIESFLEDMNLIYDDSPDSQEELIEPFRVEVKKLIQQLEDNAALSEVSYSSK